jgi:hypothetical protein
MLHGSLPWAVLRCIRSENSSAERILLWSGNEGSEYKVVSLLAGHLLKSAEQAAPSSNNVNVSQANKRKKIPDIHSKAVGNYLHRIDVICFYPIINHDYRNGENKWQAVDTGY